MVSRLCCGGLIRLIDFWGCNTSSKLMRLRDGDYQEHGDRPLADSDASKNISNICVLSSG